MRGIALVFICLLAPNFACQANDVADISQLLFASKEKRSNARAKSLHPLRKFALLILAFKPEVLWQFSSAGHLVGNSVKSPSMFLKRVRGSLFADLSNEKQTEDSDCEMKSTTIITSRTGLPPSMILSEATRTAYPALCAFLEHTDVSYHLDIDFQNIRSALLEWYRLNRRHLPWRGDAPPYNGSTAGIVSMTRAPSDTGPALRKISSPISATRPPSLAIATSPYGIWVSEIMCQQTRIEAVIPYWLAWMEVFPSVEVLAAASEEEVNAKWAGLGFYRRAKMLHEGSKQVVRDFNGSLPTTVSELLQIKGIGPYTAGAIASISHGIPAPIVDGNILRVIARLCAVAANPKENAFSADGKLAWQLAKRLVEAGGGMHPGEFNQAIMEIGATLCSPSGTGVDARDPLAAFYRSVAIGRDAYAAHQAGNLTQILNETAAASAINSQCHCLHKCAVCANGADAILDGLRSISDGAATDVDGAATIVHSLLPLPVKKKARREERLAVAALYRSASLAPQPPSLVEKASNMDLDTLCWLLVKRPDTGLLAGQWEFPHTIVAEGKGELPPDPGAEVRAVAIDRAMMESSLATHLIESRVALPTPLEHIFSHVRHTMHVVYASADTATRTTGDLVPCFGMEPWTTGGRTYCWMDEQRMSEVGVTAGVLKVTSAFYSMTNGATDKQSSQRRKKTRRIDKN